jgi:hypothetical protein
VEERGREWRGMVVAWRGRLREEGEVDRDEEERMESVNGNEEVGQRIGLERAAEENGMQPGEGGAEARGTARASRACAEERRSGGEPSASTLFGEGRSKAGNSTSEASQTNANIDTDSINTINMDAGPTEKPTGKTCAYDGGDHADADAAAAN